MSDQQARAGLIHKLRGIDARLTRVFDAEYPDAVTIRSAADAIEQCAKVREALTRVTAGMDRAGFDNSYGSHCPWCHTYEDEGSADSHKSDCALVAARVVLASSESAGGSDD